MSTDKLKRLTQVAKELNISIGTIVEYLGKRGHKIDGKPNTKIDEEQYHILRKEFATSILAKEEADKVIIGKQRYNLDAQASEIKTEDAESESNNDLRIKVSTTNEIISSSDLVNVKEKHAPLPVEDTSSVTAESQKRAKEETTATENIEKTSVEKEVKEPAVQLKIKGKIDLEKFKDTKEKKSHSKTTEKNKGSKSKEETIEKAKIEKEELSPKEPSISAPETSIIPPLETISAKAETLKGLTVLGKINLPVKDVKNDDSGDRSGRKKRKRILISSKSLEDKKHKFYGGGAPIAIAQRIDYRQELSKGKKKGKSKKKKAHKEEVSEKVIQDQIKATLAKLSEGRTTRSSLRAKYRREKRTELEAAEIEDIKQKEIDAKVLKVTEFVTANELAILMDTHVTAVISCCLQLGLMVSINQRLDAEIIGIIAEEFGFKVEFVGTEETIKVEEIPDNPEDLKHRAPIVTVMGHVDHGKTSLLDSIRKTKVTEGEAGGITQHIGAYQVELENGKKITFIDTPGHEAFTAMRARGAKVTDLVILVVAADDGVKPQTVEAINHATAANVPMLIAINKIDKEGANTDKIKEELSQHNILVEDWGGKFQCQLISAKKGIGIKDLLDKILLEAELLDLKANPDKNASGTVIEAKLDKGRGIVTTILVQSGTIKVGDILLCGQHFGKVKAMHDDLGKQMTVAGPSEPVLILGMNSSPQAGDRFLIVDSDKEAREIAGHRAALQREQKMRTKKHITLDEIGRRLMIGNFRELNIIVKGDVLGSVEALSDSFAKLSTEKVHISIILRGVGQITESDVMLASASDAIIVGFQVRPSLNAKKLAEKEGIDLRLYSIIYDAIEELKTAMEGMLIPETVEKIVSNVEVREIFKITKVGTIAGCIVQEGTIARNAKIRIIRDGIVIHTGELASLKRFKEDASEVKSGFECGLAIKNFNDLQVKDIIEAFEMVEVMS
ncbi:MAG: translation initiation factor IF-2, partial [Bacteroidetes bacterium RIFCSPLOWO2_02_FULL_36_8]